MCTIVLQYVHITNPEEIKQAQIVFEKAQLYESKEWIFLALMKDLCDVELLYNGVDIVHTKEELKVALRRITSKCKASYRISLNTKVESIK